MQTEIVASMRMFKIFLIVVSNSMEEGFLQIHFVNHHFVSILCFLISECRSLSICPEWQVFTATFAFLLQAEFATCVKNLVSRGFITKVMPKSF